MYSYDRRVARDSGIRIDVWDGQDHYWPKVPGFDVYPMSRGNSTRVTYEYEPLDTLLYVDMDATNYVPHPRQGPGTFVARGPGGQGKKGQWKDLDAIPGVLRDLVRWSQGLNQKIEQSLEHLGGSKWSATYDSTIGELYASYQTDHDDAVLDVRFDDVDEVVFKGASKPSTWEIMFSSGADYRGSYGKKSERGTYRSTDDIKKVLKKAEGLWGQWVK